MNKERFGVFFFFALLFFFFIEARIIIISLFPDEKFLQSNNLTQQRGKILDKNGIELAISKDFFSIYLRPSKLPEEKKMLIYKELAKTGLFEEEDLKNIFSDKNFIWLLRKGEKETLTPIKLWIERLKKEKFIKHDELGIISEKGRFYPYKEIAHLIGNVSIDNTGISGIENSYNEYLEKGIDIQLTIDKDLSIITYQELENAVNKNLAESGSVVIIDNENMEILSIVSYPTYNPNEKIISTSQLFFPAISYIFEPGSTMKIFAMSFALEKGIVNKDNPLFYCPAEIMVGETSFKCLAAHGYVSPEKIIQKSCNVGMIQIADKFKKDEFYNYLYNLGFGKTPEINLPGVEKGILRQPQKWSILSKYMISIGQEIGVTALQLALCASIIGNHGIYKKPKIVKNTHNNETSIRLITENGVKNLIEMMTKVISEEGTALSAKIEGISIAGKTGTGQIAKENGQGYYKDLYNAVFVGFIPGEKPKYTILVVIHKPKAGKNTGGIVAAPTFANIVRRMIINGKY